ncbi:MAG: type II toxin-antitoxin system RelE/ParE family toxin [Gemmatimonadaceae bacterium]|nr:type II toxin-antitoxin system RelE/ParE family toxin [Gemmatimonadaceae bacterium]
MNDRPVVWLGDSRDVVRTFPKPAKRHIGRALDLVVSGHTASDWKSMSIVGPGVREIRIHSGGEFRILYVARFRTAVYVLHAFEKKTAQTPHHELTVARRRLAQLVRASDEE